MNGEQAAGGEGKWTIVNPDTNQNEEVLIVEVAMAVAGGRKALKVALASPLLRWSARAEMIRHIRILKMLEEKLLAAWDVVVKTDEEKKKAEALKVPAEEKEHQID